MCEIELEFKLVERKTIVNTIIHVHFDNKPKSIYVCELKLEFQLVKKRKVVDEIIFRYTLQETEKHF